MLNVETCRNQHLYIVDSSINWLDLEMAMIFQWPAGIGTSCHAPQGATSWRNSVRFKRWERPWKTQGPMGLGICTLCHYACFCFVSQILTGCKLLSISFFQSILISLRTYIFFAYIGAFNGVLIARSKGHWAKCSANCRPKSFHLSRPKLLAFVISIQRQTSSMFAVIICLKI